MKLLILFLMLAGCSSQVTEIPDASVFCPEYAEYFNKDCLKLNQQCMADKRKYLRKCEEKLRREG